MVVREIEVIKKPRNDKVQDRSIQFPPLQNLHLHMMENKKKLKKGLPIVQIRKEPAQPQKLNLEPYTDDMMAGRTTVSIKNPKSEAKKEKKSKDKKEHKKDKKDPKKKKLGEDADEEAGEDEEGIEELEISEAPDAPDAHDEDGDDGSDDVSEEDRDLKDDLGDGEDGPSDAPGPKDGGEAEAGANEVEEEEDPYAGLSPEEREAKEKEEYIWRFKIMKKKYRNRDIPDYNEHDDLETMKTTYERKLREISLDENVDSYKTYLILGFHAMEFVCTQWLGVDLVGFANAQKASMDKYDSLLIELGEKSRSRWFSSLPVEIRLLGYVIIQAGLFYLGKVMFDSTGSGVKSFFNTLTGTGEQQAGPDGEPVKEKKKMRGPSVKVDELKKKVKPES